MGGGGGLGWLASLPSCVLTTCITGNCFVLCGGLCIIDSSCAFWGERSFAPGRSLGWCCAAASFSSLSLSLHLLFDSFLIDSLCSTPKKRPLLLVFCYLLLLLSMLLASLTCFARRRRRRRCRLCLVGSNGRMGGIGVMESSKVAFSCSRSYFDCCIFFFFFSCILRSFGSYCT